MATTKSKPKKDPKPYWASITSWEKACKRAKVDPKVLPSVKNLPPIFSDALVATYQWWVVTRAVNTRKDGTVWEPNYNNGEWKYEPRFIIEASDAKPSGFGYSHAAYGYWDAFTSVGSRLCCETSAQVYHINKHFEKIQLESILILKK